MVFVYILFSKKDGRLYIGSTTDLARRFSDHNNGRVISTKDRRPFELIYYEAYLTEDEAGRREKFLKGGNGREQLKLQLDQTFRRIGYRFRKAT